MRKSLSDTAKESFIESVKASARETLKAPANRSIFVTNLRRYWPGAAFMYLVYFVAAVRTYLGLSYTFRSDYSRYLITEADFVTREELFMTLGFFTMLAGMVAAMLCFHYLMNPREAVIAHSLPLRRETHLFTAAASGMCLLGAPIVAGGALFFFIYAVHGLYYPLQALFWIASYLIIAFFMFGISAFFAMLTGNSIAHGILTLLFVNLPAMLEAILYSYCDRFFFGFVGWAPVTVNINPFYLVATFLSDTCGSFRDNKLPDAVPLLVLLAAGAVFAIAALLVYKRRRTEAAGDVIAIRQVRPVLRYGAALGFSFLFGLIFMSSSGYDSSMEIAGELAFSILGGVIGFLIAEMFIRKTMRVFKRCWPGMIGFALVFAAAYFALLYDLPGYGRYKLDADKVDVIIMNDYNYRALKALLGDSLSSYETLADLDIDDPDGYLDGMKLTPHRAPSGKIPPYIARQIIDGDETVMRGDDALAAVSLQRLIASNAYRFRGSDLPMLYKRLSIFKNQYNVPFIARLKSGRIVRRNYNIYIYTDPDDAPLEQPEADFVRLYENIVKINNAAKGRHLINCAKNADSLEIEIIDELYLKYLDNPVEAADTYAADEDAVISANKKTSILLERGEWNGLYEAYAFDRALQNAQVDYGYGSYVTRDAGVKSFIHLKLAMPDGYEIYSSITTDDATALNWIVKKRFIANR